MLLTFLIPFHLPSREWKCHLISNAKQKLNLYSQFLRVISAWMFGFISNRCSLEDQEHKVIVVIMGFSGLLVFFLFLPVNLFHLPRIWPALANFTWFRNNRFRTSTTFSSFIPHHILWNQPFVPVTIILPLSAFLFFSATFLISTLANAAPTSTAPAFPKYIFEKSLLKQKALSKQLNTDHYPE